MGMLRMYKLIAILYFHYHNVRRSLGYLLGLSVPACALARRRMNFYDVAGVTVVVVNVAQFLPVASTVTCARSSCPL